MAVVFPEKIWDYEWLLYYNACISLCSGDYKHDPMALLLRWVSGTERRRHKEWEVERTKAEVSSEFGFSLHSQEISPLFSQLLFPLSGEWSQARSLIALKELSSLCVNWLPAHIWSDKLKHHHILCSTCSIAFLLRLWKCTVWLNVSKWHFENRTSNSDTVLIISTLLCLSKSTMCDCA